MHEGQVRKGRDQVPYIYHPLLIACHALALLTKNTSQPFYEETYYGNIAENEVALIVKLLDRCNNVSGMSTGFTKEKIVEYINETEKWFYPLLRSAKTNYPKYSNQIFLIKYHMVSVIDTLKYQ